MVEEIHWVNLLLTGVISATVSGGVVLWNAQLERIARRKEALLTAAKDLAVKEVEKFEKFGVIVPFVPLVAKHYEDLQYFLNHQELSEELKKAGEDSLKDPDVQRVLQSSGLFKKTLKSSKQKP